MNKQERDLHTINVQVDTELFRKVKYYCFDTCQTVRQFVMSAILEKIERDSREGA